MKSVIPNVTPGFHIPPTVIYYMGGLSDMLVLSSRVADRLLEYAEADLVKTVVPGAKIDSRDVTDQHFITSVPLYDQWITPQNATRWAFHRGAGMASAPLTSIRVVICSTSSNTDSSQVKDVVSHVQEVYANQGIANIEISFIGMTDQPLELQGIPLTHVMYVSTRVLDRAAATEHLIVSFVGSQLSQWLHKKETTLRSGGKKIRAIWVGSAAIFVDAATVIRFVRENLMVLFMRLWRSEAIDQTQALQLKAEAAQNIAAIRQQITEDVLSVVRNRGWLLETNPARSAILANHFEDPKPSGILQPGASVSMKLFGEVTDWWLGSVKHQLDLTELLRNFNTFWHRYVHASELIIAKPKDAADALTEHYADVAATSKAILTERYDVHMRSLSDFLHSQLFQPAGKPEHQYGISRLIEALNYSIDELAKPSQISFGGVAIRTNYADTVEFRTYMAENAALQLNDAQRKIARARRALISPLGLGIRMLAVYPIIVAMVGMYGWIIGTSWLTWIFAGIALLVLTVYEIYRGYGSYARQASEIRARLFHVTLAPDVLAIAQSVAEAERERMHINMVRLREIYTELNALINQNVLRPIPVVSNRELPAKYVFQHLRHALGDKEILVDASFGGEPWDILVGEQVRVYMQGKMHRLSWIGTIKHQLNAEARTRQSSLPPRAEIMLLERIATRVFAQQRQAITAMDYLRSIVEAPIAELAVRDPVQLELLIEDLDALGGGKKWAWLAQNALVNVVPRVTLPGVIPESTEVIILSKPSDDLLGGATGRSNTYWREPESVVLSGLEHEIIKLHIEFDVQ